jgi:FkbM family methyltransferase
MASNISKDFNCMILAIFKKIRNAIPGFEEKQFLRVKPWVLCHGDKTFRLDYNLDENSIVIDLGGYEGQWASDIFSKYQSHIYIFEPYTPFFENIKKRFLKNKKIMVYNFGLASESSNSYLSFNGDNTSSYIDKGENFPIQLVDFMEFYDSQNFQMIDLIKINIEGAEYDLLESLLIRGNLSKIKNIQVQFHDFVPNAEERVAKIRSKLELTHKPTYIFDFVWENWELISV